MLLDWANPKHLYSLYFLSYFILNVILILMYCIFFTSTVRKNEVTEAIFYQYMYLIRVRINYVQKSLFAHGQVRSLALGPTLL